jgi:virginiamycin B lyase
LRVGREPASFEAVAKVEPERGAAGILFAAILAAAVLLVLPPLAGADIYWSNLASNSIGRASGDGSDLDQGFIGGGSFPYAVAVDGSHVYWTNTDDRTIGRANLDGSEADQSFIAPGGFEPGDELTGLAVDGAHIYWADFNAPSPALSSIGRADIDGSDVITDFIDGGGPIGVAVDGGHIYWANFNTVGRADLDGSEVDERFITGTHIADGVAVDGSHLYWANGATNAIGRAKLDGSDPDQSFITNLCAPVGVAVDAAHIYWTNFTKTIGRANLDGTGVDEEFVTTAAIPYGVAATPETEAGPPSILSPPTPLPPGPPAPPAPKPANDFAKPSRKANLRAGTLALTAIVPGAGTLSLTGRGVRKQTKHPAGPGPVTLIAKPTSKTAAKLRRSGAAAVVATVTFIPTGGDPKARTERLFLRLARH